MAKKNLQNQQFCSQFTTIIRTEMNGLSNKNPMHPLNRGSNEIFLCIRLKHPAKTLQCIEFTSKQLKQKRNIYEFHADYASKMHFVHVLYAVCCMCIVMHIICVYAMSF